MAFGFSVRIGRWEFSTKSDHYSRAYGLMLMRWNGGNGYPVWQWNFCRPKWEPVR